MSGGGSVMTGRRSVAFCCVLFLLMALAGAVQFAWSQEVTAAIVGTVVDPSGAPIKGATVTATDSDRGSVRTAETNDSGAYNVNRIPVGTYALKVAAPGFQTAVHPPLTLVLNQTARIDVQMKVGQITETVEVTGAAPVLQTEAAQVSTIIDSQTNERLPLATRNYVQLTLLAPGAISPDPTNFNNGDNTANGARPYINGNREQANNFLLDGMDNNQVSDNLLGYTPAPDAIQEFNLITQNASAEFGNFEGGIISATIKSGTNSYHGDAWEFFRNDVLNAKSWSNNFNGLPKDKLRWNMFGATFGGPVFKNKLFFFVDYQRQRFDIPSSFGTKNVFTTAERTGDFSALCPAGFTGAGICSSTGKGNEQLYNPCVSFTAPCTPSSPAAAVRQPFLHNQIPSAMISPVAQALFASSLYPTAIGPSTQLQQNSVNTTARAFNVDQGDIKVDYKA